MSAYAYQVGRCEAVGLSNGRRCRHRARWLLMGSDGSVQAVCTQHRSSAQLGDRSERANLDLREMLA